MRLLSLAFLLTTALHAQWDLQPSHTTASLRGIHALGGGVAWASGTDGTVLRTTDDGLSWQRCPTPPAAEHLDFRGIQAFDRNTALVMSSGKGDLSRLYKTTDSCQSWKLVFTNPDKDGFYDGLKIIDSSRGIVFGDPAKALSPVEAGYFAFRIRTTVGGSSWVPVVDPRPNAKPGSGLSPLPGEAFFAASNSSLAVFNGRLYLGTSKGRILSTTLRSSFATAVCAGQIDPYSMSCGFPWTDWSNEQTPMVHNSPSAGIFSLSAGSGNILIAVGGNYMKPHDAISTAVFSADGQHWQPAQTPPHGYRSAVAYSPEHKAWITVGPNGTDLSTDDGRNWRALKPGPTEPQDADRNWNALSLPFVVGPQGRIGRLRPGALPPAPREKKPRP